MTAYTRDRTVVRRSPFPSSDHPERSNCRAVCPSLVNTVNKANKCCKTLEAYLVDKNIEVSHMLVESILLLCLSIDRVRNIMMMVMAGRSA